MAGSLLAVLLLPSLLPLDAYSVDLRAVLQAPGLSHILGTDENGRDVLARLLVGGRGTLGIALLATLLAVLLGVVVGGIAGYRGGVLDALLMRGVDLALAFPSLFAILLVAAILPAGPLLLIGLIGATGWMATARVVRARVQTLLGTAYVEAARALGVPDHQVLWRHLVPNLFGLLVVSGLVQFSRSILAEATISFLGFGIQPPAPTWGNLLMDAQNYVYTAPWLAIAPGLAITGTLLAVSALGVGGPAGRHRHPVTAPSHEHTHDESGTFAVKRSASEGRDSLSPARR